MNKKSTLSILAVFALIMSCFAAAPWTASAEIPIPDTSPPLPLLPGQAPIYLNNAQTDRLKAVYTGNSANIPGWEKITANGAQVYIRFNGDTVGYFVFNKQGNAPAPYQEFLKITIYGNNSAAVAVTIRWDCSKYYAYADISAPGDYYIPQLMQDNGKTQSFDQIWLNTTLDPTGLLTPVPELSTLLLIPLALGVGCIYVMRKQKTKLPK